MEPISLVVLFAGMLGLMAGMGVLLRWTIAHWAAAMDRAVESQSLAVERVANAVAEAIRPRPLLLPEIEEGEAGELFRMPEDDTVYEYPDPTDMAYPPPSSWGAG